MLIYKKVFFGMLTAIVVLLYFTVYLAIVISDNGDPVWHKLFLKIRESWPSLFALVVVPVITFLFDKYIKNKKDKQ